MQQSQGVVRNPPVCAEKLDPGNIVRAGLLVERLKETLTPLVSLDCALRTIAHFGAEVLGYQNVVLGHIIELHGCNTKILGA